MNNLSLRVMAGAGLLAPLSAFAVVTAPTEFTTAKTDAIEAAGLAVAALLGVAAASVIGMIFVKYVKKIRGAS